MSPAEAGMQFKVQASVKTGPNAKGPPIRIGIALAVEEHPYFLAGGSAALLRELAVRVEATAQAELDAWVGMIEQATQ